MKRIEKLADEIFKIVHKYDKLIKVELKMNDVYMMSNPNLKGKSEYLIEIKKI
jgi:hypothetical protein